MMMERKFVAACDANYWQSPANDTVILSITWTRPCSKIALKGLDLSIFLSSSSLQRTICIFLSINMEGGKKMVLFYFSFIRVKIHKSNSCSSSSTPLHRGKRKEVSEGE